MPVHTIRLRAPWRRQRDGNRDLWERAFGCPSSLSKQETVRLVLEACPTDTVAILNEAILESAESPGPTIAYDITGMLHDRNQLVLNIVASGTAGREPPVAVRLEIESDEGG